MTLTLKKMRRNTSSHKKGEQNGNQDISGKRIIVSAHTITVKNQEGKTAGMVRNISTLDNIQPNKQLDFSSKLRKAGLSREIMMKYLDKIIVYEGELFFLVDDYSYSVSQRLGERIVEDVQELEKAMTIIHCERIQWSTKRR